MNSVAIFCGGFYSPNDITQLVINTKSPLSWANNTLQWAYIRGLQKCYNHFYAVSLAQIGSYPFRYRKQFYRPSQKEDGRFKYCTFCNITYIKKYSKSFQLYKEVLNILEKERQIANVDLYIYDLDYSFLNVAVKLKLQFCNVKLCVIVPDLPDLIGKEKYLFWKWYGKLLMKEQQKLYKQVDAWILLSKFMTERIPEAIGKSLVVEGMINTDLLNYSDSMTKVQKIILYTGAVSLRNNCLALAKAFLSVPDPDACLFFCGLGDAVTDIRKLAEKDTRIKCLGQMSHIESLSLQKKAWLLVNPRQNSGDFSRYSFPSKLIEYYASGTPVLMYRIDGVPDEYYNYCFIPYDLTINALTCSMVEILNKSEKEMMSLGNRARDFILKEKNCEKQCRRVVDFIYKINS